MDELYMKYKKTCFKDSVRKFKNFSIKCVFLKIYMSFELLLKDLLTENLRKNARSKEELKK